MRTGKNSNDWNRELRTIKPFQHIKQQLPDNKATLFFKAEHPVLFSEWVDGKPLAIWNLRITLFKRQRLLDGLAQFLLKLWTTTSPPLIPTEALRHSVWLTESLDRGLRRTLDMDR